MKMVKDTQWYHSTYCRDRAPAGWKGCMILFWMKDFDAWLQISQIPMVRFYSVSFSTKFVKEFFTKFLLDIATLMSYKATEYFP